MTAYLARRHERQQKLGIVQPAQLPADLQQRLDLRALVALSNDAPPVDTATIQALASAMLRTLETTVTRLHFNDASEQRARAIHCDYLAELFPFDSTFLH